LTIEAYAGLNKKLK